LRLAYLSVSGHVSPTRYPPPPPSLLRPRYRASSLILGSSDFPTLCTIALLFTLGFGCDAPSSLPLGWDRNAAHAIVGSGGDSVDFPTGLSPTPIISTIPQAPLVIPDGRISRVRLAIMTFMDGLPHGRRFKCSLTCILTHLGFATHLCGFSCCPTIVGLGVPCGCLSKPPS